MKKLVITLLTMALVLSFGTSAFAKTSVKGYTKKNGTHVAPHNRTDKDSTKKNNWSTKGNVNPETGKKGTKKAS
ncbi:hypothetical protein BC351_01305 [Paenibacillus ferrarius]|uniref:Uncharacterized protein n=1 Tax=Paenibacillus ferrarius TaxID=1469647 RepID=A0A1V4HSP9_9BACL|nr:hypothetical protein [Paenibacillus ferrarius]OPH61907.1 hypothetical protein BC351_01305 [Paenibacillus ferrarius]